jgi:preprotein translocase subunit SecY
MRRDLLFVGLLIFFCYFLYGGRSTRATSPEHEEVRRLHRHPPGARTAEYIDRVLSRITLVGAICRRLHPADHPLFAVELPFYFGGTALLIVVGVALDTVAQIETHMLTRSYQGFMKRGRLRGRR